MRYRRNCPVPVARTDRMTESGGVVSTTRAAISIGRPLKCSGRADATTWVPMTSGAGPRNSAKPTCGTGDGREAASMPPVRLNT